MWSQRWIRNESEHEIIFRQMSIVYPGEPSAMTLGECMDTPNPAPPRKRGANAAGLNGGSIPNHATLPFLAENGHSHMASNETTQCSIPTQWKVIFTRTALWGFSKQSMSSFTAPFEMGHLPSWILLIVPIELPSNGKDWSMFETIISAGDQRHYKHSCWFGNFLLMDSTALIGANSVLSSSTSNPWRMQSFMIEINYPLISKAQSKATIPWLILSGWEMSQ